MSEYNAPEIICNSVFKSGKNTTTEQEFTKKWIELINILEKDKNIAFAKKDDC